MFEQLARECIENELLTQQNCRIVLPRWIARAENSQTMHRRWIDNTEKLASACSRRKIGQIEHRKLSARAKKLVRECTKRPGPVPKNWPDICQKCAQTLNSRQKFTRNLRAFTKIGQRAPGEGLQARRYVRIRQESCQNINTRWIDRYLYIYIYEGWSIFLVPRSAKRACARKKNPCADACAELARSCVFTHTRKYGFPLPIFSLRGPFDQPSYIYIYIYIFYSIN